MIDPRAAAPPSGPSISRSANSNFTQRELEAIADADAAVTVCDRGTIDGGAYWPGPDDLWSSVGTTREAQLRRYDAVIHLRTPTPAHGYNHANPLRVESAAEAVAIDERILLMWDGHPQRVVIEATPDFHKPGSPQRASPRALLRRIL